MRNKLTRTLAAVTLAVAMPIGLATHADAKPLAARPVANTAAGCVVTPLAPQRVFTGGFFRKTVNYPTYVWCRSGRQVFVQDMQFARSHYTNFPTGWDSWYRTFPTWPHVVNRVHRLPRYLHYPVGTYHLVRFQVSNGMFLSPWSAWETSPTTWVWN